MLYEFISYQMQTDDHLFWIAESKVLKGCVGQGDTLQGAITELEENEREWLSAAEETGIPIPSRTVHAEIPSSGKVSLRVSPFVHQQASDLSKELGISLNQFLNDAIVNYIASVESHTRKSLSSEYETVTIINFKEKQYTRKMDFDTELEEM